jgi:hypothetical protein
MDGTTRLHDVLAFRPPGAARIEAVLDYYNPSEIAHLHIFHLVVLNQKKSNCNLVSISALMEGT